MSINPTDETVDLTEKSVNEEQNENMKSKVGTEDLSAGKESEKQDENSDAKTDETDEQPQEAKTDNDGLTSVTVTHMSEDELLIISMRDLMSSYVSETYTEEEKKRNQDIIGKFQKYYGKDFDVEKTKLELEDPKLKEVAQDYLNEKLEGIKNKALSMDISQLNDALNEIYKFIGFSNINLSATPKAEADLMFNHRVGHFQEMADTYMVLDTVRDILDISTDSTMSLGSRLRLDKDIEKMKKLRHRKAINREQMAIIYENVGRIHEHYFAKDKNNTKAINKEQKSAGKYMEEALKRTSDVNRIQSCVEYLQEEGKKLKPKIARMAQEAYERFFADNAEKDEHVLSKAHEKYADVIIEQESYVGFISETTRKKILHQTDLALSHYAQAIETSPFSEDKVQILNKMIYYLGKFRYTAHDEALWKSVNVVTDAFAGNNKIKGLMQLLPRVEENKDLKKILLETSINELLGAEDIDDAKRNLLLKNTGQQWLKLADKKEDAKGIKKVTSVLEEIENQEKERMQKEQVPISRVSSKGIDYFS